ncbi:hypothetical protein PROFUN_01503, partial [Planoprotostelium fungivorum]
GLEVSMIISLLTLVRCTAHGETLSKFLRIFPPSEPTGKIETGFRKMLVYSDSPMLAKPLTEKAHGLSVHFAFHYSDLFLSDNLQVNCLPADLPQMAL